MEKPTEFSASMAFVDRPLAKVHKFYLSGEIKAPSEYVGVFETIRNASENDVVVLHINSYGGDLFTAGKGGEMYDNIVHEREWSHKLWKDVYSGFLSDNEIQSILQNKDIWMSGEEVTKRLNNKFKKPVKKTKASQRKKAVSR